MQESKLPNREFRTRRNKKLEEKQYLFTLRDRNDSRMRWNVTRKSSKIRSYHCTIIWQISNDSSRNHCRHISHNRWMRVVKFESVCCRVDAKYKVFNVVAVFAFQLQVWSFEQSGFWCNHFHQSCIHAYLFVIHQCSCTDIKLTYNIFQPDSNFLSS